MFGSTKKPKKLTCHLRIALHYMLFRLFSEELNRLSVLTEKMGHHLKEKNELKQLKTLKWKNWQK